MSVAGEIVPTHEFYSYESKYLDENGAALLIPAKIDDAQMKEVQAIARRTFTALECEGMARVDFFLDKESGRFYLNEINTIPGFTSISMRGPDVSDADGKPVHAGDMRAELGQALDNLETVLGQAGLGLADVVRLNYYTTDIRRSSALRRCSPNDSRRRAAGRRVRCLASPRSRSPSS